jgi:hypothetical protein
VILSHLWNHIHQVLQSSSVRPPPDGQLLL